MREAGPTKPPTLDEQHTKPVSPGEWQVCADIANHLLFEKLGRQWGMVDEIGHPNWERAEYLLAQAHDRGILPRSVGPVGRRQ